MSVPQTDGESTLVVFWDKLHAKEADADAKEVDVKLSELLEALQPESRTLLSSCAMRDKVRVVIGCCGVTFVGADESLLRKTADALQNKHQLHGDALYRAALKVSGVVVSPSAPPESLQLVRVLPRRTPALDQRLTISVCRATLASVRTGNSLASVAYRAARHLVRAAVGSCNNGITILNTAHSQPLTTKTAINLLQDRENDLTDDVRETTKWLKKVGFEAANGLLTPPEAEDQCYFVVITRGAYVHDLAVTALLEVLDNNRVLQRQLILNAAPPPPIQELFSEPEKIFGGQLQQKSPFSVARTHIETMQFESNDAEQQLIALGFDKASFHNQRLFSAFEDGSLLGVRRMALEHVRDIMFARDCVRKAPLGDGERREESVEVSVGEGDDERSITLIKLSSQTLVPRFDPSSPRREQMREFDVEQLFGSADDSDECFFTLFHGTTIDHASQIVANDPDIPDGKGHHDFGGAFYLTDDFAYALEAAYQISPVSTQNARDQPDKDPAVLVYRVPLAKKEQFLSGAVYVKDRRWITTTYAFLHDCGGQLHSRLKRELYASSVIVGPIVGNGRDVAAGGQPEEIVDGSYTPHQFAFRNTTELSKFGKTTTYDLYVVRVLMRQLDCAWGTVATT